MEGNGIHTNNSGLTASAGNPSNWNAVWREYIEKHPNASRQEILANWKKWKRQQTLDNIEQRKGNELWNFIM